VYMCPYAVIATGPDSGFMEMVLLIDCTINRSVLLIDCTINRSVLMLHSCCTRHSCCTHAALLIDLHSCCTHTLGAGHRVDWLVETKSARAMHWPGEILRAPVRGTWLQEL
jgi:hypothetical protein